MAFDVFRRFMAAHWQLLLLVALVFVLWRMPIALPLRLLVVLFHEISHAAVALLTGGRVLELTVALDEGGHARFAGGSFFWVASAGYLGSLAIGLVLLAVSVRTRVDRGALALLGAILIVTAVLYVRELFALVFCLGTGALFVAIARSLQPLWSDVVLRVIGLTSLFYVPYDIFSDTLARAHLQSDAAMIAERYFGTTMFWGGLWLVVSLFAISVAIRMLLATETHLFHGKTPED